MFTTRLGESIKKQEAEDMRLREEVAQAGDKLRTLQLERDSLKDKQRQYTAALEESESILNSLKVHMESEVAVQVILHLQCVLSSTLMLCKSCKSMIHTLRRAYSSEQHHQITCSSAFFNVCLFMILMEMLQIICLNACFPSLMGMGAI